MWKVCLLLLLCICKPLKPTHCHNNTTHNLWSCFQTGPGAQFSGLQPQLTSENSSNGFGENDSGGFSVFNHVHVVVTNPNRHTHTDTHTHTHTAVQCCPICFGPCCSLKVNGSVILTLMDFLCNEWAETHDSLRCYANGDALSFQMKCRSRETGSMSRRRF